MANEDMNLQRIRVALLSSSQSHKGRLPELLSDAGLEVIPKSLTEDLSGLQSSTADVVLIDASNDTDSVIQTISKLSETSPLPVYIHDGSQHGEQLNSRWAHKLAQKLRRMAGTPAHFVPETGARPATPAADHGPAESAECAVNVWILAGSLGAPEALMEFLGAVHSDTPVAFILAQHISAKYMQMLAEQLDHVSPFYVLSGQSDHLLCHRQAVAVPAGTRLTISRQGKLNLDDVQTSAVYAPSIDDTIDAVLSHYGERTGVIVFSGIGNDGVKGCQRVAAQGGRVWIQEHNSCVVANLPDQVERTGIVSFRGDPVALAQRINRHYQH